MPNGRLRIAIQRMVPFIGYHHVLMILIMCSWILSALLLAGCTSSSSTTSSIYLLSITYHDRSDSSGAASTIFGNASTGGSVTVRAGYLGICARAADQEPWICASGASGLGMAFAGSGTERDPLDALQWAQRFKSDVVFPGFVFGAIALSALAFFGLSTFPGWHEERDTRTGSDIVVKPFPSRPVSRACLFLLAFASLFLMTSALWQHVAAATAASIISTSTQGYLSGSVGPAAAVLVWLALAFTAVAGIGILVMILSIHLLDGLTDD
ncbi:unnamed protein product [Zymoseptoria tritici ST99CH_3D7]|uniref:Ca2+ regulator and membrane fusion protein Fig1-domain-containing protein n=1 Tax=Zymoseptoria tritici (strain ST99CH_3D7) TaxID=1276538 RepID=A0A1X7RND8_ZYMT9|nr:unnamed protein product [Zymoseptoria tritici ST99CH_3D7]